MRFERLLDALPFGHTEKVSLVDDATGERGKL
jgi:hypothetical protein